MSICNNSFNNLSSRPLFCPLTTPAQIIAQMTFYDIIGVPLFLMISGALLLKREYPSPEKFLKKRFAIIIYPFIFWIIVILGQLYLHGYNSKFTGMSLSVSRQLHGISGY